MCGAGETCDNNACIAGKFIEHCCGIKCSPMSAHVWVGTCVCV